MRLDSRESSLPRSPTELQAKLTSAEKTSLGTKPTNNPEAYVVYLRALDYEENADVPFSEDNTTLDQLYAQAIALDPKFALAYARASMNYSNQFWQARELALKRKRATWPKKRSAYRLLLAKLIWRWVSTSIWSN